MKSPIGIVMCGRVDDEVGDAAAQVPGTVEVEGSCGHDVYVAPASQDIIAQHDPGTVAVICLQCAREEPWVSQMAGRKIEMAPETRRELEQYVSNDGMEMLKRVLDLLNKDRGF